ncbi:MAG: glutathione S-transferase GstA-like [Ramlibacter sp.]|nr:glutathione S-transferase GstA-like [Ramlibacter sp.]
MTIRYYFSPATCSLAGMAALELAQASYSPVAVDLAGDRAELRAINPVGKVPALAIGNLVITDTIAIIYWLAGRFPQARLMPVAPDEMSAALAVMGWFGSTLHIIRRQYVRPALFSPDPAAQQTIRAAAAPVYWAELQRVDEWIAAQSSTGPMTSPGVQAYALLFYHWAASDGLAVRQLPHFTALAERLLSHTGVVRALELHASPLLNK